MAITINGGTGVITGVAVGGLPDGVVDSGTLATNSVDSAELIDGAVDDSHMAAMAASKLTGALPAISGASLTNLPSTYSLIHNSTSAAAARAFTGMSRTTYTMGWWIYFNTVYPSTAGDIELLVSGNDGSSYHGAYTFAMGGHDWDGAAINRNITSAGSEIKLNIGTIWNIAPAGMSGWIFIPQSLSSANVGIVWSMGSMENSSSDKERYIGFGACDNAVVDINAFKIETSNGSNVNGHIQVYGLKPS